MLESNGRTEMLRGETRKIQKPSVKYQFYAATVVNLLCVGHGATAGWCSPNLILLTSDDSPLTSGKITIEEASWIASILCVGGLIGNIFYGFITNAFGRKLPLILTAIPAIIGWFLILIAQNVYYLYAARLINGFIGGGVFNLVPLYLNEIASDSVRGVLGSTFMFTYNGGMLLAFVLGDFCEYETTPTVIICLTLLCLVLLCFLPETPVFLMRRSKISETEKSLRFYQNRHGNENDYEIIQSEMEKLRKCVDGPKIGEDDRSTFNWSDLLKNPGRKAMIIGIALALTNQLCGCFAMLQYSAHIFKDAGSYLSPNKSAIVVGIIQVVGSYAATLLVDRTGRKLLYLVSTTGTAFGLIVLGTYVLLKQWGVDVEVYNWIPIASFSFVIFIASWAIMTLYGVVISEVMPEKLKDFGWSFCMALVWSFAFLCVKLLPFLNETFGFPGTMFFFSGWCILSAIFIFLYLPETKAKSHEQIMKLLQN